MFTDPITVTYNSLAKILPRTAARTRPGPVKQLGATVYKSADEQFGLYITRTAMRDGVNRVEVILERVPQDADSDPFTGNWSSIPNRVGLVLETNKLLYQTATDIPLIRSALLALVDSTLQSRLIAGEM
jgi:hypothetical protein